MVACNWPSRRLPKGVFTSQKAASPMVIAQCYKMGPGQHLDPLVMIAEAKRVCDNLVRSSRCFGNMLSIRCSSRILLNWLTNQSRRQRTRHIRLCRLPLPQERRHLLVLPLLVPLSRTLKRLSCL